MVEGQTQFNPNNPEGEQKAGGEILRPPVLIVPAEYGQKHLNYADFVHAATYTKEQQERFLAQAKAQVRAEAELLEYATARGIIVDPRPMDAPTMVPDIKKNEYTVRTFSDDVIDDKEIVGEVAPEINVPEKVSLEEFMENPFYPAVVAFQHPIDSFGGAGIYLVEIPSQLEKIKKFMENEGKIYKGYVNFKQYINTPSDHYTSYRVLVTATGDVLASGLIYSGEDKSRPTYIRSDEDLEMARVKSRVIQETKNVSPRAQLAYLEIYESPYYLKSKRITSNVTGGGSIIPLDATDQSKAISDKERGILEAHGLVDGKAPDVLIESAKKLGSTLAREYGLYAGLDFIQDRDGNFYFLEANSPANFGTYFAVHNKGREIPGIYLDVQKDVIDKISGAK